MRNTPAEKFKETLSDNINETITQLIAAMCKKWKYCSVFPSILLQNDQRGFSCFPRFDKIR